MANSSIVRKQPAERASMAEIISLRERVVQLEREKHLLMMVAKRSPGLVHEEVRYRVVLDGSISGTEVKNLSFALARRDSLNASRARNFAERDKVDPTPSFVERGTVTWDPEPV